RPGQIPIGSLTNFSASLSVGCLPRANARLACRPLSKSAWTTCDPGRHTARPGRTPERTESAHGPDQSSKREVPRDATRAEERPHQSIAAHAGERHGAVAR